MGSSQEDFRSSDGVARGLQELLGCSTSDCVHVSPDFRLLLVEQLEFSSSYPGLVPVGAMSKGCRKHFSWHTKPVDLDLVPDGGGCP